MVEHEYGIRESSHAALKGAQPEILERLLPTVDMIDIVYGDVLSSLKRVGVTEEQIKDYLYNPNRTLMTVREERSWRGRDLDACADQYEHVRKVCAATVELKRTLYELDIPERIIAYQTGTGWPLPEESRRVEKMGFIRYGEGALSEHMPRGAESDTEAGMYIYRITAENGEQMTMLALKKRPHGYTETNWQTAPLDLAFMPRLLKGIGTEFILNTFASGVDPSVMQNSNVQKQDLGVVIGAGDLSSLVTTLGPMSGDQRVIGNVFGGAFKNIAAMQPESEDIRMLLDVVEELRQSDESGQRIPHVFPTVEVDTPETPNFQDAFAHASVHGILRDIQKLKKLPQELLGIFNTNVLALAHGMVQIIERDGYFQSWKIGLKTQFNRRLRELPLLFYTDFVDPGVDGDGTQISDERVQEEAKKAEALMATVVSQIMLKYADIHM